jgi:hypothetical protein
LSGTTTNYELRYPTSGDNVAALADHFKDLADDVDSALGVWTAYVPVWTASTTNPTLGNGTSVGRYIRIGDLVVYLGKILVGSTTNVGVGGYSVSLPVQSANFTGGNGIIGSAWIRDASGADYQGQVVDVGTTFVVRPGASSFGGNSQWGAAAPMAHANGDFISWHCHYQAYL